MMNVSQNFIWIWLLSRFLSKVQEIISNNKEWTNSSANQKLFAKAIWGIVTYSEAEVAVF